MPKNLDTADKMAKLSLSVMCLVLYFIGMISGPFAYTLMILSIAVIVLYVAKIIETVNNS
jgi:hypothetical protein